MMNATEQAERQYLANIIEELNHSLKTIEQKVIAHADKLIETKQFAWQNAAQLDPVELAAYRIAVTEESAFAELSLKSGTDFGSWPHRHTSGALTFRRTGSRHTIPIMWVFTPTLKKNQTRN